MWFLPILLSLGNVACRRPMIESWDWIDVDRPDDKAKDQDEPKSWRLQIVSTTGPLEAIGACNKEDALSFFHRILREHGFLAESEKCEACTPKPALGCCYFWEQGGARVHEPDFSINGHRPLELHFRFGYEKSFDADLVKVLHDLPFESPADRANFANTLSEQGIYKESQLQSVRPSLLPKGSSTLTARFADVQSSLQAGTRTSARAKNQRAAEVARERYATLKHDMEDLTGQLHNKYVDTLFVICWGCFHHDSLGA